MKIKKIGAALVSGVMALGMLAGLPQQLAAWTDLMPSSVKVEPLNASAAGNFRRVVSNESPMWIVHIDSWNYADPAKIIDLVPEDILPYVVFNISLSINWDSTNHKWLMIQDGAETARSWMRTCAEKGVWTMIQPASGGQCHFPDYPADYDLDNTIFGEFFKEYPNFLGYNYCEQFWGFASKDFPVTYQQRYSHFAALLKLCNKYGGYLDVSWCENQWGSNLNPIAMLKTNSDWEQACRKYKDNFILEEKYTQSGYIADVESEVYGAYISGYCGNYGVRWDDTGWTDYPWKGGDLDPQTKDQYRLSTALPILLERMVQNGMTVIDGPELVWADCIKENWTSNDKDGYGVRSWSFYDQFQNDFLDLYRKFNDGSIRIPSRQEVISRTKAVIIQDVNSGSNDDKYCTYKSLFEGLYRIESDGNLKDNHNPFKTTGRYQTIPTVYALTDDLAKSIPVQIKQSSIPSRWSNIEAKQAEFNKLYPSDYWGNCYAGRNENTWVTYNPNKTGGLAGGYLNLKYNTCKQVEVTHDLYGSALINEYTDHIDFYLSNYDEDAVDTLKTETLKIYGCSAEPTIVTKDRGVKQTASQITTAFSEGTYTITVKHNGPVDIQVKCSGTETDRQTAYQTAVQKAPEFPAFYDGVRQYEAEFFDRKNIEENVTNGCRSGVTGYWGQGFMKFGTKNTAAVRDTVFTSKPGDFEMKLRYAATSDINQVDLYVNGVKNKTLTLSRGNSYSDWKTVTATIPLVSGDNQIELKANNNLPASLYLDCFQVSGDFGESQEIPPEPIQGGKLFQNLLVNDAENRADWSIVQDFGIGSEAFGDRQNITISAMPKGMTIAEAIRPACDSKMYTKDLGSFTAGEDFTLYIAEDTRVIDFGMPEWLVRWERTGESIFLSNDLELALYKKDVKKGEEVTLGMNGGNGYSVCYLALAVTEPRKIIGDVNVDGKFDMLDAVMLQKWLVKAGDITDWQAGDLDENGVLNVFDLALMKHELLKK